MCILQSTVELYLVSATVFPEFWTHPPFSAHKDDQGNIFGRGTQDMKSVGLVNGCSFEVIH